LADGLFRIPSANASICDTFGSSGYKGFGNDGTRPALGEENMRGDRAQASALQAEQKPASPSRAIEQFVHDGIADAPED
jgi:hypothetical protein